MSHEHERTRGRFRSLFYLTLLGSLAIAAFYLIAEHRAHIFGGQWSGAILLAAFVGLHLLMHAGHGGHGGHAGHGGHSGHGCDCSGGRSSDKRRPPEEDSENDR